MQALARAAGAALRQGAAAGMSTYSKTAAQLSAGSGHGSGKADKIGLLVMLPTCAAFIAYDVFYPEEEFEGKIPEYPYLRIRTRAKYPWGSDRGPFEFHQFVGGEEHEH